MNFLFFSQFKYKYLINHSGGIFRYYYYSYSLRHVVHMFT